MTDTAVAFCELTDAALIRASGADARTFLHAQLTSDIAGLPALHTQYAGYCSAKGRLLATFLVWNLEDAIILQLPGSIAEDVRTRLAKYVMRSKVLLETTTAYSPFGLYGSGAAAALAAVARAPAAVHEIAATGGVCATRLPGERFAILAAAHETPLFRDLVASRAPEEPQLAWQRRDIEQGVPIITRETQEQFVPQMVNLDLIGGVSYSKGCYPGQEIVARMHYLGRLKQRMHIVTAPAALEPGDPIYSSAFGADQASGTVVNAAPDGAGGSAALAVVQTAAVTTGDLHSKSMDGPALELKPPPYPIPA